MQAALSAFDAQFSTSTFWNRNDRAVNNVLLGGGTNLLVQEHGAFQAEISKRAATGNQIAFRNNTIYDGNNQPNSNFPSAWDVNFEAEIRHPLLQGGGIDFNRIAGPNATPGFYFSNGVLIARINTDISLADFESSVRDFLSDVENAYWDLYYGYRELNARMVARDNALETWRNVQALYKAGRRGGEAEKEAQAREQYFLFQIAVENSLMGVPDSGTLTSAGGAGTFRSIGGVYTSERRLRFLMGLPANDDRLIRPATEPNLANVVYDWESSLSEAISARPELRRQRWIIKRRELELVAARNFLMPRLDLVALQRWRGFGDDLASASSKPNQFDNAYQSLTSGEFQEWQVGVQLNVPLGFRQGAAGVRNAQLQLAREHAVLHDQELYVSHLLANSISELYRAFTVAKSSFNRLGAAQQQLEAIQAAYQAEAVTLDLLLDAQRRLADANSAYYRALVEHALAIKGVHYAKGSLLEQNGIFLAEGAWPGKAYQDAQELATRFQKKKIDYRFMMPSPVSSGPIAQGEVLGYVPSEE